MEIKSFEISGIKLFMPKHTTDERGYFAEIFRENVFKQHCGDVAFVQENESLSQKAGTVRGLHFQSNPHAQGKLVRCTAGALFDVAVDIRRSSPSFGKWLGVELTPSNGWQLWVPEGFAHGFCSLKPETVISYKVTDYYCPDCDKGVAWDDPEIAINWPGLADPETLSRKDRVQSRLADVPAYFTWSA
jgi:dTDP-4-dehydrorhamnose 3,5-epimerase